MHNLEVNISYAPIIEIIEEAYEIPHFGRKRRFSALLPYNYYETDKHYPVLYLQDGQNLFDDKAPFGNWAIDKSLEEMAKKGFADIIIIAIDHGGEDRITEFMPYFNPRFGEGKGSIYLDFIETRVIPYINKKYRTMADPKHTGIGGSSMGGLISLFAGLNRQHVFNKLMVFSPSLWVAPKIFQQAKYFDPQMPTKLYIYAGGKESEAHIPNVRRLTKKLLKGNKMFENIKFELSLNPNGTHSELYWREEFPKALKWLYFN